MNQPNKILPHFFKSATVATITQHGTNIQLIKLSVLTVTFIVSKTGRQTTIKMFTGQLDRQIILQMDNLSSRSKLVYTG